MASLKKKNRGLILGLMGCVAQQEGANLIKRFPVLDLVMGPREIYRINEFLERIENHREKVVAIEIDKQPSAAISADGYFSGRVKSFVTIMEGCNNFCSYCIVPYVRGREASRPHPEIIEEIQSLTRQGIKEVMLLGQNVNSYFDRQNAGLDFTGLLKKLEWIQGLQRVRFTTSHPKDLSHELIFCFKDIKNLCPHIHLPVQAGSNPVLKRMNRGYDREKYIDLIYKLRESRPDMAITSDMMVGFPGETDQDFQMTIDLIQKIEFDNLFSFKYSDRKGTKAEKMGGKIPEKEKSARLSFLQNLQKQITLKKNKALEGHEVEILVEGQSKKGDQLSGRALDNRLVNFISKNNEIGNLINVKIKRSYINSLWGEIPSETETSS
jgi:tRNA-2-methylthio-N6-dimethylallyladenosine synthase